MKKSLHVSGWPANADVFPAVTGSTENNRDKRQPEVCVRRLVIGQKTVVSKVVQVNKPREKYCCCRQLP